MSRRPQGCRLIGQGCCLFVDIASADAQRLSVRATCRTCSATLPPTAALLGEVGRFAYGELGRDSFALHDPLAVAAALQPDLLSQEDAAIVVDTTDNESLGQTRIVGPGRIGVALAVDADRARRDFRETVGLPVLTP